MSSILSRSFELLYNIMFYMSYYYLDILIICFRYVFNKPIMYHTYTIYVIYVGPLDTLLQHPFPQKQTPQEPTLNSGSRYEKTDTSRFSLTHHRQSSNAMAILMRLCLITWTLSWPVTGDVSLEKAANWTQLKRQRLGFLFNSSER